MKHLIALILSLSLSFHLLAQENKFMENMTKGDAFYDQGKYNEAIVSYKAAIEIDQNSASAKYKLAKASFGGKHYEDAVKYSAAVIEQNSILIEESYILLGISYDSTQKSEKAIVTFEKGISKFPKSNLLYYHLASTCFAAKDYEKAEASAIEAINIDKSYADSHLILSLIMQATKQKSKAMLPLYYFLMLEPDSKRSAENYKTLQHFLGIGLNQNEGTRTQADVESQLTPEEITEFDAVDMMIDMLAASRNAEENKNKSDLDFFIESNKIVFSVLGELKGDNKGFWWDFYAAKFHSLIPTDNCIAFGYYISQSTHSDQVKTWINNNREKIQGMKILMNK